MRKVIVFSLLALVVVVGLAFAWLLRFRPLALLAFNTRVALRSAGLSRVVVDSPSGPQSVFVGGEGPVLVLLHGAGDQAGTWFRLVPELKARHRLIVPDLAGHGDSAPGAGPISVGEILAGVEAVLDREAPGKAVTIAGNSLGAWIAMLVADREPARVARVIAINGGAIRGSGEQSRVLPASREQARESMGYLRDASSPPVPDFVLDDVVRQAATGPLARFASTASSMEQYLLDGRLSELRVPVDLIWGASDRLMSLDYAERMRAALPHATLTTIERCGHVPQVECPDKLLAVLQTAAAGGDGPAPEVGAETRP